MMENCVSYHPHAFYDENGIVKDIFSMGGHEKDLAEIIKNANNFSGYLSICEIGWVDIGDTWDGEKIIPKEKEPFQHPMLGVDDD